MDERLSLAPRRATLSLLVALALLVGACSDDDPASDPVGQTGNGPVPPDDGTGAPVDGEGTDPDDAPVVVAPPEIPPGREDRPGLIVRFPGDREPGALVSPWLAVVDVFQIAPIPDITGDLRVDLSRYDDGLDFRSAIDFYTPELDVCNIPGLDRGDGGGGGGDDGIDGVGPVDGGETLTLSSAGGTWLSVPYSSGTMRYEADDAFPGLAPADLTLSLPGGAFPRIDALPLFVPAAPERLSPAIDEPVTPATEYRWAPGDGDAVVRIVFKHDIDGEFAGFPGSCRVLDDGAFELPADALAALADLPPGETRVRYSRDYRRLDFRDGVIAFQSINIADD